ncbi:hypothetical protein BOTBODRAFT_42507 [Botryobasidium botryosum FD-172 SS1]|uniref:Uncharacterized protein n=1 Tax=Botryobasidium botryosum (strain FD-172 SS1) TaxID=930990 RepID=A0A067N1N1_BOTB1|nr:hypothetical protein BOTBODRAFT_42507 [Botryobasidium botryosum FD-172 SS1]
MAVAIEIVPLSSTVEMFGTSHTQTAYSVSGHILLTLKNPASLFEPRPRAQTIELTSIQLVFEGSNESIYPDTGYRGVRLCRIQKELILPEPILLTGKPDGITTRWSIVFDLAVPGWLPPSAEFEDQSVTSYALFATAKYAYRDTDSRPPAGSSSSRTKTSSIFSNIYSLTGRNRIKSISAPRCPIEVRRFRTQPHAVQGALRPAPEHTVPSAFGLNHVSADVQLPTAPAIPLDLLRSVEVILDVPGFVGTREGRLPMSVRVRSRHNDPAMSAQLSVQELDVEVQQVERFWSRPCTRYADTFPLPPKEQQPPNLPLLSPHPLHQFAALGITTLGESTLYTTRTIPLVPAQSVQFRLSPARGGVSLDGEWAKMDITVPVLREVPLGEEVEAEEDGAEIDEETKTERIARRSMVTTEMDAPFYRIRHEVRVNITLAYQPPNGANSIIETVHVSAPLRFVHIPSSSHTNSRSPSPSPAPLTLPAYSQLFYENGERKELDHEVDWLPAYRPEKGQDEAEDQQARVVLPSLPLTKERTPLHEPELQPARRARVVDVELVPRSAFEQVQPGVLGRISA